MGASLDAKSFASVEWAIVKWVDMNIGIFGFGRIGVEHAGWLSRCDGVSIAGIFDPTPARREIADARGYRTVDSGQILLDDPAIDAVLIATPTSFHFEQAMAALAAGKHVMIEKPMALDLAQAKKIAETAKARGLVVSVFHNRRWDIDYLTVESAVRGGVFGRIFNVESRLGQWGSCVGPAAREYRPNWRNERAFGGGGWLDWGTHFVDQLWRLMVPARPVRVFAQLRGNLWTNDCDDFARVIVDFDNGATGLVEINTTTRLPLPRWHIDGSNGSVQSPYSPTFDTQEWAQLDFHPGDGSPKQRLDIANMGLSEVEIWQQFARSLGGAMLPAVPIESVLPTMQLLELAWRSSAEGRALMVE